MTHPLNTDYNNMQNQLGIIVCDLCGQTSTVQASADGSWEFVYKDNTLHLAMCPKCATRPINKSGKELM